MKIKIKMKIRKLIMFLFSYRKIKKKVVFISFGGMQYSSDPKAISLKLHEKYPDFEQVWVVLPSRKNELEFPNYVRVVDTGMGMMKEIADTFAFVTTNPIVESVRKRQNQFFVQTWHGDRGMKKALYEVWPEGKCPFTYLDNKYVDIAMAGSDWGEDSYHRSFGYYGKISKVGMPRNDKLIANDICESVKIKEALGIPSETKILTYAPTFRDGIKGKQNVLIDIEKVLYALEENGDRWVCLIRGHAGSNGLTFNSMTQNVMDVSLYPDMADILLVSDMLITDYSSCAGDYLLRRKPLILALFDLEEYKRDCRDIRVDFGETGYIIAKTNEELISIIRNYSDKEYIDSCNKALDYYGTVESGCASEYICNEIKAAYDKYINQM